MTHSNNTPQQDDKQLREAIRKLMESFARDAVDASKTARGFAYGNQVDRMVALFTTAQLQLVSELLGELPQKEARPEAGPKRNGTAQAVRKARNKALDEVAVLLEHKKQELERGK